MELPRRYAKWSLSLAVGCVVLAGCSPLTLLNALSGTRQFDETSGIAYGAHERHRLDVYRPSDPLPAAPVVVFFYGGGWRNGSRKHYRFVASALAGAGYTVVIPDYRVFPNVRFPTFVEDAADALAWALANAADFGADPDTVFLMGHSAGAHIAALLALDERYLRRRGADRDGIAGFVGIAGPYDFLPLRDGYLTEVFPPELRAQSQPVRFVTADAPPALLIHGQSDDKVSPENSRTLAEALDQAGVAVRLELYDGIGHARIVAALAPPLGFLADTLEDTLDFMRTSRSSTVASDGPPVPTPAAHQGQPAR